jgi:hypothetical protein
MRADERLEVGRPDNACVSLVEDHLRHVGRRLDLGLENVRLQRIEQTRLSRSAGTWSATAFASSMNSLSVIRFASVAYTAMPIAG